MKRLVVLLTVVIPVILLLAVAAGACALLNDIAGEDGYTTQAVKDELDSHRKAAAKLTANIRESLRMLWAAIMSIYYEVSECW